MVTKRVLLFGGDGQVGQAICAQAIPPYWQLAALTRKDYDIAEPDDIARAMRDHRPEIVINAAAIAGIDDCEANPELAMRVNFEAVAVMAGHCTALNAPLIQISTDYVFDGTDGPALCTPETPMNPLNVYGQSKMMGEEAARHGIHWHVILRTALVFSEYGENILTRTLRSIDSEDNIELASDQIASPTSAEALASGTVAIASAILAGKADGFGTFHLAGGPAASRYEFTKAIMEAYAPYTSRRPNLHAVKAAEIPKRIPRPLFTALDFQKTETIYGIKQSSWRDDLKNSVRKLAQKRTA